jgi:hypothetical protein
MNSIYTRQLPCKYLIALSIIATELMMMFVPATSRPTGGMRYSRQLAGRHRPNPIGLKSSGLTGNLDGKCTAESGNYKIKNIPLSSRLNEAPH